MKNIVHFYSNPKPKNLNYKYITPQIIDDLIDDITNKLITEFKNAKLNYKKHSYIQKERALKISALNYL